ncbi:transcriptional regulator, TetR family [Companilactobacillus kimchiensis]|uniref:Transcriptional regulator, TetR family n=2 Tax=Companilactobacillus kimchiensis TaxID=993692 RepID=A0A0R2LBF0_9LACO|nr:transcriptional regulator, TetR family [Companilactobacillus kimchiensis]
MSSRQEEQQIIIESLKVALFKLMKEKSFNSITVSELVKTAGIARSTFYRHFNDKLSFVRSLIQTEMDQFDAVYQPQTIEERFEDKYIKEVWHSLLGNKAQIKGLVEAGLSHIYLEEFNHHLLKLFPYSMTIDEKIHLYGLAGAQYNIIFNLYEHI